MTAHPDARACTGDERVIKIGGQIAVDLDGVVALLGGVLQRLLHVLKDFRLPLSSCGPLTR